MAKEKDFYNRKEHKELMKILKEKEKNLMDAKIDVATGKAKDVHKRGNLKREIAKIKTALSMKSKEDTQIKV